MLQRLKQNGFYIRTRKSGLSETKQLKQHLSSKGSCVRTQGLTQVFLALRYRHHHLLCDRYFLYPSQFLTAPLMWSAASLVWSSAHIMPCCINFLLSALPKATLLQFDQLADGSISAEMLRLPDRPNKEAVCGPAKDRSSQRTQGNV